MAKSANAYLIQMSNISGDGIADVKAKACDILLDHRLTQKAKDPKKAEAILNRLHISQPKKRDNIQRGPLVPETVTQGVKKTGPTIKQLQEEYGGAGNFIIPVEEHFMLEKEEWRYDKWPEFFNGSNVMDFYDPDIERKLAALEKEEDELLRMERDEDAVMDDDEVNEEGISFKELKTSLKEVRGKKAIFKLNHKLNAKLRAHPKNKNLSDMLDHFESKGLDVNKETLRSRSKSRRSIADLEASKDKLAARALDESDDDSDVVEDEALAQKEGKERGRKRRRERSIDPADYMEVDEDADKKPTKLGRSLTPA